MKRILLPFSRTHIKVTEEDKANGLLSTNYHVFTDKGFKDTHSLQMNHVLAYHILALLHIETQFVPRHFFLYFLIRAEPTCWSNEQNWPAHSGVSYLVRT